MQTFDQSLMQLYRDGLIGRTDALAHADEPGEMRFALDRADFERERRRAPPDAARSQPSRAHAAAGGARVGLSRV